MWDISLFYTFFNELSLIIQLLITIKPLIYSFKLVLLLSFLLLMRGGTPRYRYDYLTKLGWFKFLSFSLSIVLILIFFFLLN